MKFYLDILLTRSLIADLKVQSFSTSTKILLTGRLYVQWFWWIVTLCTFPFLIGCMSVTKPIFHSFRFFYHSWWARHHQSSYQVVAFATSIDSVVVEDILFAILTKTHCLNARHASSNIGNICLLLGTNKPGIERITLDYIVSKSMGDNGI